MSEFLKHQVIFVSTFGDIYLVVVAFAILFFFYFKIHKHLNSAILLLLSTVSVLYSLFLKGLFMHPRPEKYLSSNHLLDLYSFPSSHVMFYTSFWGFLLYLSIKYRKEQRLFLGVLQWVCIYFISLVGISRVLLDAHHVQDVIAGYLFGGLFLLLLILIDKKTQNMLTKN